MKLDPIKDATVLALVLLVAWQHVHHERAVARWRRERRPPPLRREQP
jgi:hypothetical protein